MKGKRVLLAKQDIDCMFNLPMELTINADAVAAYLNSQIEAGAQAVMIFDSWGGVLADGAFQQFSLAYTRRVLRHVKTEHDGTRVPRIVFTKGGGLWLDEIAALQPDVIGLDWTVNLAKARDRIGARVALQGNLDPAALFASPKQIEAEALKVLEGFGLPDQTGSAAGHIFNLGHGVSQHTAPESVGVLVEAVHRLSRRMRAPCASVLP